VNKTRIAAAITSCLTMLAALPYELGEAATIIPPAWKARLVVVGLIATLILRAISSAQTPPPKP
jgi:hypothetical protein